MKIIVAVILLLVADARADEPWVTGVTPAQRQAAQALLERGNALFLDKKYADALEQYKAAVASWDHPAIRFNIVRCLIQLERPVEASDNLELALKYGAAPMDETVYNEALSYQKLLASQIGDLEVSCTQPAVKVTLDGKPLLVCPGKEHRRAMVGQHQLVGTKDGFLTMTSEVIVLGGKQQRVTVALLPLENAAKVAHRWSAWLPWSVFGGGLVVAGLGGLIQLQAAERMASYDKQVTRNCSLVHCDPNDPTMLDTSDKAGAEQLNAIAIGVMSVGAAAVVTGGVMLYLNRGRTVYDQRVDVVARPDGGVVMLRGRW